MYDSQSGNVVDPGYLSYLDARGSVVEDIVIPIENDAFGAKVLSMLQGVLGLSTQSKKGILLR